MYRDDNALRGIQAVTNYLITGDCPDGVRPEVMEILADILAYSPTHK